MKIAIGFAVVLATLFAAGPAFAGRCRIKNTTSTAFTVESGNTSNQRIGARTDSSIASGKIIAKGDNGKGVGGHCNNGDRIKIVEEKGVFIILPQ